jgi:hypothetical protein
MGYVVGCLMAFQLCGPLKDANMPDGLVYFYFRMGQLD